MADLNAMLNEAVQCDQKGEFGKAAIIYDDLLTKVSPEFIGKLNLYKGVSLFNKGDTESLQQAVKAFDLAIGSEDPQVLNNAWPNKARALERLENWEEACKAYEQAFEVDEKREFVKFADFAHCLNQSKQYEKALEVAGKGLKEQPALFERLHNERIFAFFKLKKPLDCLEDVESVLKKKSLGELRPEQIELYSEVLAQVGHNHLSAGQYEEALRYFERVHDATATPNAKFLVGVCYLRMRDDMNAEKWLADSVKSDGNNWKARVALGTVYMRPDTNDFEKAVEQFNAALTLSIEAKNPNVYFNLGFALMKLRRDNEAKPSLQFVYDNDKSNWIAAALLGMICVNDTEYQKAIEVLTQAIDASKGEADDSVYYNLAYAYMMLNRYKEARDMFAAAFKKNPRNLAAKQAMERMAEEVKAEEDRLKQEEEDRKRAEKERIEREKEAERQRIEAEAQAKRAAKERDEKVRKEAEKKAKEEKEKLEKMRREAEERKQEEERQKKIKIQEARERRMKRLAELQVQIGGPQRYRARRPSLDLIPEGNTGKNAHAYADWYNEKVVNAKDAGI